MRADTAREALHGVWTVEGNKMRCLVSAYGDTYALTCALDDRPVIGYDANHGVEQMDGWLPAGATGSIAGKTVSGVFRLNLAVGSHVLRWRQGGHVHAMTIGGPPSS